MSRLSWSVLALLAGSLGAPLLQPPRPTFTPLQPELFTVGATLTNAAADYDGDGDADLFVGFNGLPNRLYRNAGGQFEDVGNGVGLASTRPTRAAAWGDLDADGDPDLVVGFAPGAGSVLVVYRNDGGRFADVTSTLGVAQDSGAVRQLSMIDVDGDDDLDLFVAFRDRPNALFEQQANGQFANVAGARGLADPRRSVGAVWFDYEQDGDLDVYVGNMDGDANGLYRNVKGQFTDVAEQAGAAWAGRTPREPTNGTVRPCAADVNGDGRLDLFGANYGRNGLLLARADGTFEDVSVAWRVNTEAKFDACAFADIDHDGRLDLYVNGTVTGGVSYRDYLLRNTGSGFDDITPASLSSLGADHGVQWLDVDRNGALDLALTGTAERGLHGVWMSALPQTDAARSLQVQVTNVRGRALRAGAEVLLYVAGSRRLLGMRLLDSGSGYDAQSDLPVHFGLPAALPRRAALDVAVVWPTGVRRDTTWVRNVRPTNQPARTVLVKTKR
jgi:FG-GAP-like repeat/ASPIC and UnbV